MPPDNFSFEIRLLGAFSLLVDGTAVTLPRKGQHVIACLTLNYGATVERSALEERLWPESLKHQRQESLRKCLLQARGALGRESARIEGPTKSTLRLNLSGARVDAFDIDSLADSGEVEDLVRCLGLYTGVAMPWCTADWIEEHRRRFTVKREMAAERIAALAERANALAAFLISLRRAHTVDRDNEPVMRALLRSLTDAGEYEEARQTYRTFSARLNRAGGAPQPETVQRYQDMLHAAKGPDQRDKRGDIFELVDIPGRLPKPQSDIIGRDDALIELEAALDSGRMVTLTGPGGIGKTRLALAAAHANRLRYRGGAWFVGLASAHTLPDVCTEVASVLGIGGAVAPDASHIAGGIGKSPMLLVLDNCEQAEPWCRELAESILRECPNVTLLATSRTPLEAAHEKAIRVRPLMLPRRRASGRAAGPGPPALSRDQIDAIGRYSAVELFDTCARAAAGNFSVTARSAPYVVEICRMLDCNPLAIELAAAWARVLGVRQIFEQLRSQFSLLNTRDNSRLERHRSLYAAIAWSHQMLSPECCLTWECIALLPSLAPLAAVRAACGAADGDQRFYAALRELIHHSMLNRAEADENALYELPVALRSYIADRGTLNNAERTAAKARIARFYAEVAARAAEIVPGAEPCAFAGLAVQQALNIRAACTYAVECGLAEGALAIAAGMFGPLYTRGHYAEAYALLNAALPGAIGQPGRAAAEICAGNAALAMGSLESANRHFENAYTAGRRSGDKAVLARGMASKALVAIRRFQYSEARALLLECRPLFEALGDLRGLALTSGNLGIIEAYWGNFEPARDNQLECIGLARELGELSQLATGLTNLCSLYISNNRHLAAHAPLAEAIELAHRLDSNKTLAHCLLGGIALAVYHGDFRTSVVLAGADKTLRADYDEPVSDEVAAEQQVHLDKAMRQMRTEEAQRAFEEGESLEREELLALLRGRFPLEGS